MFRTLRKAASSLERTVGSAFDTAFSTPSASHTAFVNAVLTFPSVTVKIGQVIAEGGFSFVHIAKSVDSFQVQSTRIYAVKRLSIQDKESKRLVDLEISFLTALPPHPNIVPFHGAVYKESYAFLLFDLVDGGTLPERLKSPLSLNRRSAKGIVAIFFDIVSAITHLHAQTPPVALRDVKLENILYDRFQRRYKLCDFGSVTSTVTKITNARHAALLEEEIGKHCTAMYRAPELADVYSSQFICEKVDVWSLGCILHALMFDSLPFDGTSSLAICNGLGQIPETPDYPPYLISILQACLTVHPGCRPDSFEVLDALYRINDEQMPSELVLAANRLRDLRSSEFSDQAALPIALDLSPQTSAGMAVSRHGSKANTTSSRGESHCGDDESDNWADFASAFASRTKSTRSVLPSAPGGYSTSHPNINNSDRVSAVDAGTIGTLIDFSDMGSSSPSRSVQQPRHSDSTNLIDF